MYEWHIPGIRQLHDWVLACEVKVACSPIAISKQGSIGIWGHGVSFHMGDTPAYKKSRAVAFSNQAVAYGHSLTAPGHTPTMLRQEQAASSWIPGRTASNWAVLGHSICLTPGPMGLSRWLVATSSGRPATVRCMERMLRSAKHMRSQCKTFKTHISRAEGASNVSDMHVPPAVHD